MSGMFTNYNFLNSNLFQITTTTNSTYDIYQIQQAYQQMLAPPPPMLVPPRVTEVEEWHQRAMDLLIENLNKGQQAHLKEDRSFYVRGGYSGDLYRVFLDYKVWCPSRKTWYCIIQDSRSMGDRYQYRAPTPDIALTKKLLIECDEQAFLKIACAEEGRLDYRHQW